MRIQGSDAANVADPHLRRAYELATRGVGRTAPNPAVGCVVVKDGRIVGEGHHIAAGAPHAEIEALRDAGGAARGATVYVTLEPCDHHGRTPPCVAALVEAGVADVVIGMKDPDTRVSGGGAVALAEAGVTVRMAEDPGPFERLNAPWLHAIETGRPWVRAKVAVTLDGRVALRPGVRSRLTRGGGYVTSLARGVADAVMVGASTLEIDRPRLTARAEDGRPLERQPIRVVLCRSSLPSPDAVRALSEGGAIVLLAPDGLERETPRSSDRTAGARIIRYDAGAGLDGALLALASEDVEHVLVEPGPRLLTSLWDEGLIDQLVLVHAGGMAGRAAPALYRGGTEPEADELVQGMVAVEAGLVGGDAATVWEPV